MGSLALRPGDLLTIPRMALSVGFICFVSSTNATQATGLLTLAPVGLSPTEHASLRWSHYGPKTERELFWSITDASRKIAACGILLAIRCKGATRLGGSGKPKLADPYSTARMDTPRSLRSHQDFTLRDDSSNSTSRPVAGGATLRHDDELRLAPE